MLKKEEIQQNAETFGKVSPLLAWFAHRVTTHVMKDDDTDEEDEGSMEEGALVKKQVSSVVKKQVSGVIKKQVSGVVKKQVSGIVKKITYIVTLSHGWTVCNIPGVPKEGLHTQRVQAGDPIHQ